ncbi:hypothetical protein K493DRAFT_341178 [Basidiobolus meristosporus CBS 931.73]|uniref:RRN7-type domain-containing protein n=1 Tax=Basidiobolus meristosporus CBS 931.73 TaxID=1314790 RepID=A0A1Y1XSF9_9FUNG|nr:hypothetical protein K493DRAFT_341178 [Basidiobolus meristosporus CBS 931.73]|eukprot:ORX88615.1 hypothetical protein K493DRAFT_341178 [Basidiobolus meristosporus CBS 931.73]
MKKPTCPICKSRRWFRNDLGFLICEFGHQLQGHQEEELDIEDVRGGRTTRKKRLNHNEEEKRIEVLYGERGRFLLFQCFQIILRKQLNTLIVDLGFPAQLEKVVQELWTLYVSQAGLTINESDVEFFDKIQKEDVSDKDEIAKLEEEIDQAYDKPLDENEENDPEEVTVTEVIESEPDAMPATTSGLDPKDLRLEWSLILCYLGMQWLKLPVLLVDLHRLASNKQLAYLTAYNTLPQRLLIHISKEQAFTLRAKTIPSCDKLHRSAAMLARFFENKFSIVIPEINTPPVLYRFVRELVLPSEFFVCAMKLIELCQFNMHIHSADPPPSCLIMGALIASVKLFYGFDDVPRAGDPLNITESLPKIHDWFYSISKQTSQLSRTHVPSDYSNLREYAKKNLDEFVEFCQEFVKEGGEKGADDITRHFESINQATGFTPVFELTNHTTEDDDQLASFYRDKSFECYDAGDQYISYQYPPDPLGAFHPQYGRILEIAGKLVGVHPHVVHRSVALVEAKMKEKAL